jgi:hypothetical protein
MSGQGRLKRISCIISDKGLLSFFGYLSTTRGCQQLSGSVSSHIFPQFVDLDTCVGRIGKVITMGLSNDLWHVCTVLE